MTFKTSNKIGLTKCCCFQGGKGTSFEGEESSEHEEVHGRTQEYDDEAKQEKRETEKASRNSTPRDQPIHQKCE
jgi:hypothetical protein